MKTNITTYLKIIFCTISFAAVQQINLYSQPLNGTFIIGKTNADFPSLTNAVYQLKLNGISGPVKFIVRNGIYEEQLSINDIKGTSEINTISFVAENEDSASTIITFPVSKTTNYNYLIHLDNSKYITFKGFLLKRTGNTGLCTIIKISNSAHHIEFHNNQFTIEKQGSSNIEDALIFIKGVNISNILFNNNYFQYGSYGIYSESTDTLNLSNNNTIISNKFINQYFRAISLKNHKNIRIENNYMDNYYDYPNYENQLYKNIDLNFIRDSLLILKNKIINFHNTALSVVDHKSVTESGIIANNMISVTFANQTNAAVINMDNCSSEKIYFNSVYSINAYGLYITNTYKINLYNNIISSSPYLCKISAFTTLNADYNCYYTTELPIFNYGTNYYSLTTWKNAIKQDTHSVFLDPQFISRENLHINKNVDLKGKGQIISEVINDIDEDIRNTNTPDIGADEYTLPTADLGIIRLSTYQSSLNPGIKKLNIIVKNFGINTIDNFQIITKINSDTLISSFSNLNLKSSEIDTLTLTGFLIMKDSSYNITYWIKPVDYLDGNNTNDTLKTINLQSVMGGIYTIGGINPNYPTLSAAISDLTKRGIYETTILNIRRGKYDQVVNINNISGTSPANKLIIQSEYLKDCLVSLQSIFINNAKFITIRHLTIVSADNIHPSLRLSGTVEDITINNNKLIGESPYSISSDVIYLKSSGICKNILVKDNLITNGKYGIYFESEGSGSVISNNIFLNLETAAINITNHYTKIYKNYISDLESTTPFQPIVINSGNQEIVGNKIFSKGSKQAIKLSYSSNKIYNNFIYAKSENPLNVLEFSYSFNNDIQFNTIKLVTSNSNSCGININAQTYSSSYENTLKNNIIFLENQGRVLRFDNHKLYSNYNCFYTKNNYIINNYSSFILWKFDSGKDSASFFISPTFLSDLDLHIKSATQISGKGKYLETTITDIDDEPRYIGQTDIGADQFSSQTGMDAGVISVTNLTKSNNKHPNIYCRFKNFGTDTLYSLRINTKINSSNLPPFDWKGKLAPGDTTPIIKIAEYYYNYDTLYTIKVWTNCIFDKNNGNDTSILAPQFHRMGGNYTIGGINSDFCSIENAVKAINNLGVQDSTIFIINDGLYKECVTFNQIKGASEHNYIKIKGDNLDKTQCVLDIHSDTDTAVFRLNGTNFLKIENLTIVGNIKLFNNSKHITIQNCNFKSYSKIISASTNSFLNISNNTFTNSVIWLIGQNQTNKGIGNSISNNTFLLISPIYHLTIECYFQDSLLINNNIIKGLKVSDEIIYIRDCGSLKIISNNICIQKGSSTGIYIIASNGTINNPIVIANNFISINENNNNSAYGSISLGINHILCSNVNYYHNSISVKMAEYKCPCLLIDGGQNIKILNNILKAYNDFALFVDDAASILTSDYNLFYSKDSLRTIHIPGKDLNFEKSKFSEWQNLGFDKNSNLSLTPYIFNFVNTKDYSDLHLNKNNNKPYPSNVLIKEFPFDIDGDRRDTIHPTIGADEFYYLKNNASISSILNKNLTNCAGLNSIHAYLKNYGTDTLKTATINIKINDTIFSPVNWIGKLAPNDSVLINVADYNFRSYTDVKLEIWPTIPNGMLDENPASDTAHCILSAALSGDYIIGSENSDFKTLNDAVYNLEKYGVCGPTNFYIKDGIYEEQIRIHKIKGSSENNLITFQSLSGDSSKVRIKQTYTKYSGVNFIICLDGTNFIRFKKLSFIIDKSVYFYNTCRVIFITGGSHHIEFSNNLIQGVQFDDLSTDIDYATNIFIGKDYTNNLTNYNIAIKNNIIKYGRRGISYQGGINIDSVKNCSIEISNNRLIGQIEKSVNISTIDNATISNNKITSNGWLSVYIGNIFDSLKCTQNIIDYNSTYEVFTGVLGLDLCVGKSTGSCVFANNIINVKYAHNYSNNDIYKTIYVNNCKNLDFVYNTININKSNEILGNVQINKCENLNIKNCHFTNFSKGLLLRMDKPYSSDYNNFYTEYQNYIYINDTAYDNLIALYNTKGIEKNSISFDPLFHSNSLLIPLNPNVLDKGIALANIIKDINDTLRNLVYPDMGAYEYSINQNTDLELTNINASRCSLNNSVYLKFRNNGKDTINSFDISTEINNNPSSTIWNGILLPGRTDSINIGSISLQSDSVFFAKAMVISVNGTKDDISGNDSVMSKLILFQPVNLNNEYIICKNNSTKIAIPDIYQNYNWSSGENTSVITVLTEGKYKITATDYNNCISTDSTFVIIKNLPSPPFSPDKYICAGSSNNFLSATGNNISWYANSDKSILLGNYNNLPTGETEGSHYYFVTQHDNFCESNVDTVFLILTEIDTALYATNNNLYSNSPGTYQWYNCNTNLSITNATAKNYTPTISGNYKVRINYLSCTKYSVCKNIEIITSSNYINSGIEIYPNPTKDCLYIRLSENIQKLNFTLRNLSGNTLKNETYYNQEFIRIDLCNYKAGIYFVQINNNIYKIIKSE